jgi:nucleoside-diphosphate-sugar epimerase
MSQFTVLGSRGFIGSHLVAALEQAGHDVYAPPRTADLSNRELGDVIYCIGLTADFRSRPFDTVTAHVCKWQELLTGCSFRSATYLSSTRVYQGHVGTVDETTELHANPLRPGDLYNLSKLMGESLALHCGRPCKIVRISNVYGADYGSDNFLSSILRSAVETGSLTLQSAAASAKDYIRLDDVVALLPRIAREGLAQIYNLSSGTNVSHGDLAASVAKITGCQIRYSADAVTTTFPQISNDRLQTEFGFQPAAVLDDLPTLVEDFRKHRELSAC